MSSNKKVLVIAAHPDDEVLGCGGTIALHARAGDRVTAVIVCEGESLRYGKKGVGQPSHIQGAAQKLGIQDVRVLGFSDQRLDTVTLTEIVTPLEQIVREVRPAVVYCQYGGDINRDHQLLFKALLVATRPTEEYIEAVYSTLAVKLEAMACYESEVRPYPHPRSLEALQYGARAWGNQACLDAAEVFMTVRRVLRHVSFLA